MKENSQLIKLFERYAQSRNYATAFNELLEYFLIAFKWYPSHEERLTALDQLQNNAAKETLPPLLFEIGEASEGFVDALGELYGQKVSTAQRGQLFTPDSMSTLMVMVTLTDTLEPGQSVLDPACGSGRMLLVAAKLNRHVHLYGADIDEGCCKMSAINLLLNSLTGEVAHMDSLANTFYKGYRIGTTVHQGYHYPHYIEFTNADESWIWRKTNAASEEKHTSKGAQGTLF